MNRLSRYAAYFTILVLLPHGLAAASELPSRKAGLWVITSSDNPFANWTACIDDSEDDFINSDIWSDFSKECHTVSITKTEDGQALFANCESGLTGKVKLLVDFSGDFQTEYRLQSTTQFTAANGQPEGQSFNIEGRHAGECPADLPPGKKKMAH